MLLQGKVALITGAASERGIGRATQKSLHNRVPKSLLLI